jgi:hypothetical protein
MNSRHLTVGIQRLRILWGSFEYKFSHLVCDGIMIYEVTFITTDTKVSKWYCLFRYSVKDAVLLRLRREIINNKCLVTKYEGISGTIGP